MPVIFNLLPRFIAQCDHSHSFILLAWFRRTAHRRVAVLGLRGGPLCSKSVDLGVCHRVIGLLRSRCERARAHCVDTSLD